MKDVGFVKKSFIFQREIAIDQDLETLGEIKTIEIEEVERDFYKNH